MVITVQFAAEIAKKLQIETGLNYFYKKMMKTAVIKVCLALAFLIAAGWVNPASAERGGSRDSRISTSLPFLDVTAFAEDSLGYMWIATLDGLNRYNGYEFESFMNDVDDPHSLMSNFIFCLLIDSSGDFFVGTARGLCRFDFGTDSFDCFSSIASPVYGIYEDRDSRIWVATPFGPGLVDKETMSIDFSHGNCYVNVFWEDDEGRLWMGLSGSDAIAVLNDGGELEYVNVPGVNCVTCVYVRPDGVWWLGTNEGIYFFDSATGESGNLSDINGNTAALDKLKISFMREVEPDRLLIGTTTDGFYWLDLLTGRMSHNMPVKYNPEGSAQLHSCYVDRQGNVWIGTYEKGFVLVGKRSGYFNADEAQSRDFAGSFVTRVTEDWSGALWVATRYDGLYRYTEETGTRRVEIPDNEKEDSEFLECMFIDSGKRMWIAFETYMVVADINASGQLVNPVRVNMDNVRVIGEKENGVMLVGSWNGLFTVSVEGHDVSSERLFNANVTDYCITRDGDIIFAAYGVGLLRWDSSDGTVADIRLDGDELRIAGNCVTMKRDSRGRIWLGSYGCGLMCIDGEDRIMMTRHDGLPSDNILCFEEDREGDIWASTSRGLVRIRTSDDGSLVLSNYYNDRQPVGNQYHEKCGCVTDDGMIYFGGNHGLTIFSPEDFRLPKAAPVVNLEDLKIGGHSVEPSADRRAVLHEDISLQKEIVLNHNQRSIAIDYSGIDFFSPSSLTYKYRLVGEDDQWNNVGAYRRANYSNLRRGRYEFQVYAVNDDGVESLNPATLSIRVRPAPWFSAVAWTLYLVAAFSLALLAIRYVIRMRLRMARAEMDRKEKEREKEMTKMKTTFFTNISHELRTPLTLIAGPFEKLRMSESLSPDGKRMTDMISRNIATMMKLVNQLMDFAKMESGTLTLKVRELDIVRCISGTCESFRYFAERKSISFSYVPREAGLTMWADADKVGKILNNLLSNAFKFTPENGIITVRSGLVSRQMAESEFGQLEGGPENYLKVSVEDSGKGVPKEKLGELFVRYWHMENEAGQDCCGNGIGLDYTKNLVEKHKGRIAASLREGGGMVFSFIIPADDVYTADEKSFSGDEDQVPGIPGANCTSHPEPVCAKKEESTVLVVEDNLDLQDFLVSILSGRYNVLTASNGNAALKTLEGNQVDLVLSDVIMPEMDGLELCRKIKGGGFNSIPVVLLTAKSSMDDQIEGLEEGADAYICKPFNTEYLLLVVKNLLGTVRNVRLCYLTPHAGLPAEEQRKSIGSKDLKFMDSLTSYLEQELQNPELDVDMIAAELCVSRSVLYRRIKSLTGLSPNDCVRDYRLKRAVELMDAGEPLSEVSEHCGFSSYSYFSKSFKQHFGMSPKDWLKSNGSGIGAA